jgi:hypothetical protein
MIDRAIMDEKITNSEYHNIIEQANADGIIDSEEKALLATLHSMIADGTVKRVRD